MFIKRLFSKVQFNLLPRLRLLRNALTRRYVWSDILAMAREHGIENRDIVADVEPLEFAQQIFGNERLPKNPPPSFDKQLGSAEEFTPKGEPDYYNSEPSVGRFLGQLVYYREPANVVELGCFVGWTSAHLAFALKAGGQAGSLYCVDPNQSHLETALTNLKRLGLEQKVTFLKGFSLDETVISRLPKEIDILFIDTTHRYPDTLHEIAAYTPRMAAGGLIVLHDSICWPGVRRSLIELTGRFRLLTFATEKGNGVTVLLNIQQPI
jgi:predicted O-methyltransferase YrrM